LASLSDDGEEWCALEDFCSKKTQKTLALGKKKQKSPPVSFGSFLGTSRRASRPLGSSSKPITLASFGKLDSRDPFLGLLNNPQVQKLVESLPVVQEGIDLIMNDDATVQDMLNIIPRLWGTVEKMVDDDPFLKELTKRIFYGAGRSGDFGDLLDVAMDLTRDLGNTVGASGFVPLGLGSAGVTISFEIGGSGGPLPRPRSGPSAQVVSIEEVD
jgi:hypothetical protein